MNGEFYAWRVDRYGNYSDMIKAFEKKIEKKFNRMSKKRVSSNFKCKTCGEAFTTRKECIEHITTAHKGLNKYI